MSTRHRTRSFLPLIAIVAALSIPATSWGDITSPNQGQTQPIENGRSYGYVRTLEGQARLVHSAPEGGKGLVVNQPLLVGDEIALGAGSRLELVLADHNVVRLAGGSKVRLDRMAFSADSNDRTTLLRLLDGELQIVVTSQSLGDQLPRIDTANATVYIEQPGSYRIGVLDGSRTEVVVRDGYAEVLTPDGSAIVRDSEEAWVEGTSNVRVALRQAGALDGLEGWGNELDQQAQLTSSPYVGSSLSYESSSLAGAGSWVSVSGRYAWRPYVESGWRPYEDGSWTYTPSGWTWVASAPWGWITGHYGSWNYAPEYGWLWYPGAAYAPAWVYWYWGSSYVGWCPIGIYADYYQPLMDWDEGVFWVLYGGVRAPWDYDDNYWTYSRCGDFAGHHHYWDSHELRRHYLGKAVPRGILTTDTRGVLPRDLAHPGKALRAIATRPHTGSGAASGTAVPDLTAFIARRPDLPASVRRAFRTRTAVTGLGANPRSPEGGRALEVAPGGRLGRTTAGQRVPRSRTPDLGSAGGTAARLWRNGVPVEPSRNAPARRSRDWRTATPSSPTAAAGNHAGVQSRITDGVRPNAPAGASWRTLAPRSPVPVQGGRGASAETGRRLPAGSTQSWRLGRGSGSALPGRPVERRTNSPGNLQGWHSERGYILRGPTVPSGTRVTIPSSSVHGVPREPVVRRVIQGVRGLSRTYSQPSRTPSRAPSYNRGGARYSAPRGSYRAPAARGGSRGGASRAPSHSHSAARTRGSGGSHRH